MEKCFAIQSPGTEKPTVDNQRSPNKQLEEGSVAPPIISNNKNENNHPTGMSLLDVEDEEKDEKSLTESENSECKMWQYTTNEIEQLQKGKLNLQTAHFILPI